MAEFSLPQKCIVQNISRWEGAPVVFSSCHWSVCSWNWQGRVHLQSCKGCFISTCWHNKSYSIHEIYNKPIYLQQYSTEKILTPLKGVHQMNSAFNQKGCALLELKVSVMITHGEWKQFGPLSQRLKIHGPPPMLLTTNHFLRIRNYLCSPLLKNFSPCFTSSSARILNTSVRSNTAPLRNEQKQSL